MSRLGSATKWVSALWCWLQLRYGARLDWEAGPAIKVNVEASLRSAVAPLIIQQPMAASTNEVAGEVLT